MVPPFPALDEQSDTWAALRCVSGHTLALADSLALNGLSGWSPRLTIRKRIARRRRTELHTVALLPSYVFVPFDMTDTALDLGRSGTVPRAWPFLFNGARPALPVDQLLAMDTNGKRPTVELFKPAEAVRIVAGPLRGMNGVVVARKGRDRWLILVDGRRVLVPSFLIAPLNVKTATG